MAGETILVTGVAGFIGMRLAKVLLERGERVIGLDNLNDYYSVEYKRRRLAELLPSGQFTFVEKDLRDAEAMLALARQYEPTAIAHLAAMAAVRYSVQHPLIYGQVNVQGTLNLLDAARQIGTPQVVLASTGSSYGSSTPVPFVESAAADRPLAPYPASKRSMELFAHSYHHLFKLPTTILRFFNVYGPWGRPDMMPWQWSQMILLGQPLTLYDAGKLKRDWTYIDDIVDGFVAALQRPFAYEIINLGCSRPVSNLEVVKTLEKLLRRSAIIVDAPSPASEPAVTFADITKARAMLGYSPKVDVEEGLARFVGWLQAVRIMDGF